MWNDINSLSHTKWNCKYHIVFAPKYRRKELYGDNRLEIGKILRELCKWKGVNIITVEVCIDHIHMLAEMIKNYIDNQLREDHISEQLTIDKMNSFTGSRK